ncbi:MAG: hypothetical protein AAF790_02990 [Planctomycetota bacterium]
MTKLLATRAAVLLAAAAMLGGCRSSTCCRVPATPVAPCVYERVDRDAEAVGSHGFAAFTAAIDPTADGLATQGGEQPRPTLLPGVGEAYEVLTRAECQCNAATNTTVANAVELERYWASLLIGCESDTVAKSLCLTRSLLSLQAAELRKASAAAALTSFYLLAGVEASEEFLDRGIEEIDASLRRIDVLREKNLPGPDSSERGTLAAKRDELVDQRVQLGFARVQLNGQLKRLLGCPLDERVLFLPRIDWAPGLTAPDIDLLVAEGVAARSDLRSLRLVRRRLEKATLPVARQVLQVIDGSLGAVAPKPGVLSHLRCCDCKECEAPIRCRQLTMIEADATELATGKIKGAAYKLATQQARVRLAMQVAQRRRQTLEDLERRREADDISIFEISAQRARAYEAEASLVEKLVELKVAEVALREVQGLLAADCGYAAQVCGEQCCTGCCCGPFGCHACHADAGGLPAPCGLQSCGLRGCGEACECSAAAH